MKESLIDVTNYFLSKSKPGIGSVFYENGLDMKAHKIEINTAHWILETFGGKITVLKEKNLYLISNPDYEWNDKYWELKNPSKKQSIKTTLRKGLSQTSFKQGGIIIDITKLDYDINTILNILNYEMSTYNKAECYIIIKKNNQLLFVLKKELAHLSLCRPKR